MKKFVEFLPLNVLHPYMAEAYVGVVKNAFPRLIVEAGTMIRPPIWSDSHGILIRHQSEEAASPHIIQQLELPWVTVGSQISYYEVGKHLRLEDEMLMPKVAGLPRSNDFSFYLAKSGIYAPFDHENDLRVIKAFFHAYDIDESAYVFPNLF